MCLWIYLGVYFCVPSSALSGSTCFPSSTLENRMPLETGSYVSDLVSANPAHTDSLNNADSHMRLIKAVLKNTLPGVNAPLSSIAGTGFTLTPPSGTATYPAYGFAEEPSLGFYRAAAGQISWSGQAVGNGSVPTGAIFSFLVAPTGLGTQYLELDGSSYPNTSFPALAAHLGQGGSSFVLPNLKDTGRFLRSRTASVAAGTPQANQFALHAHAVNGTTGGESVNHSHTYSGTTGAMNANASHTHTAYLPGWGRRNLSFNDSVGLILNGASNEAVTVVATNTDHGHAYSGATSIESTAHTHNLSVTSAEAGGGTETRPEAMSVIFCIKT